MKKPLLIAVIAAVIFALAVFLLLQGQELTRPIVVATQDMPVGTVVDETMLEIVEVPVDSAVGADSATGFAEIIGDTVIVTRTVGDIISPKALGEARMIPAADNGFITVTVPVQDAIALMADDLITFSVYSHGEGAKMVEGFLVRTVTIEDDSAYILLEGHRNDILYLTPYLAQQSFVLVRKAGE